MAQNVIAKIEVKIEDVLIRCLEELEPEEDDTMPPSYYEGFEDCKNAIIAVCKKMKGDING